MSNSRDEALILTEREKGRDVSVWFESSSNYMHPLKELIANATDEINNNFDSGVVIVSLEDDLQTLIINDTGRGIPLEQENKDGIPYWKILLLILFGGTNYKNGENGKITTGEHGLGLTVTNYCSKEFEIISLRSGCKSSMSFKDGGEVVQDFKVEQNNTDITGTTIRFKLDEEVFGEYKYNPDEIKDILNRLAGSNSKIKFVFNHKGETIEYHYESLEEYFDTITNLNTSIKISGKTKDFHLDNEFNTIEFVLCTSSEPVQESFLNITFLPNGGTICEGMIDGVRKFINSNLPNTSKSIPVSLKDVEDSVSFVVNMMSVKSEFANQTKLSTKKKLYKTIASEYVQELLEIFKLENEKEFDKFAKHILEVQKFNTKSQANKKALKKKLSEKVDSINNRIEGLIDCKIHGEEAEIFICEGKSALGSAVLARNPINQACIPIRGKILNCLKANYSDVLKNQIIMDLVRAIGCGIQTDKNNKDIENFNMNNLRYGKIVLTADADADGEAIVCLLLTMIYKLFPKLIYENKIYIANTPLYEVKLSKNDEMIYIYSESEKDKVLSRINDKYSISRVKGLAELEAETMSYTAMNPETRVLTLVTVEKAEKMFEAFEIWMDTDVKKRKGIIESELVNYLSAVD